MYEQALTCMFLFSIAKGDFMSSKSGFISNLNKSTKVTMASCLGFVLLTAVILVIFILNPITPAEKAMASIGRENVLNNSPDGSPKNITPAVVTTAESDDDESEETVKTIRGTTTTRTVKIRITTGSGFLWNGRIPTGVSPNGNTSTVVVEDPTVPVADPNQPVYPNGTTPPSDPGTATPEPTIPNPDPNAPVTSPVDTPDTPITPPVSPDPVPDPEPVVPDTPPVTPDPPADSGGGGDAPVAQW